MAIQVAFKITKKKYKGNVTKKTIKTLRFQHSFGKYFNLEVEQVLNVNLCQCKHIYQICRSLSYHLI